MRLSKLKLMNYRCFGPEEQTIMFDDLTAFIGNNSAGKTAALAALNCMFSENSSDRNLQRSDFHFPYEMAPDEMEQQELYIEAVFEFDELQREEDCAKYAIATFFQYTVVDQPGGLPYLRIRLDATWEKNSTVEGAIDSKISYITCPESETVEENYYVKAPRRDLDKIRVVYIPAVRDPSKQLKHASGTMMYQIMSSINWSDTTKDNIRKNITELNKQFESEKGVSMFGASLAKQWRAYDSDDRYSSASLRFSSTDIETSVKKVEVLFEPTETGKEYTIDQMSDGLRSLFYISLVDSILDVEGQMQTEIETDPEHTSFSRKPPILTIVALEEPENHIAPHLLGKLIGNLRAIAEKKNAQAIMTSHSPAIVKRIDPENLRFFRIDKKRQTSSVKKITLPEKERAEDQYKYIKEAVRAYPELYFAKLVILGEGDSEEIIIPKYWEAMKGNLDAGGISVVPLGGRHVNHFWRLLNDLDIPHITLLDLDRERDGGGWGRIKYVLQQLLANGYDRNDLLCTKDQGVLSDSALEEMPTWDEGNAEALQSWIKMLERHNVFFSAPLDIDFMMLEQLETEYKKTLEPMEGPHFDVGQGDEKKRITIKEMEEGPIKYPEYEDRIKRDIRKTLKDEGGDGSTYSEKQQKLMVWYSYFFLNRGKPSTHFAVLSQLDEAALKANIPPVLIRLFKAADNLLKGV